MVQQNGSHPRLGVVPLLAIYTGLHLLGIFGVTWVGVAVWCQADTKFGGGCDGVNLYTVFWSVFLAPTASAVFAAGTIGIRSLRDRAIILLAGLLALDLAYLAGWRFELLDGGGESILVASVPIALALTLRLILRATAHFSQS